MELPPLLELRGQVYPATVKHMSFDENGALRDGYPTYAYSIFPSFYKREEYLDSVSGGNRTEFKPCDHYKIGRKVMNSITRRRLYRDPSNGYTGYREFSEALNDFWAVDQFGSVSEPFGSDLHPSLQLPSLFHLQNGRKSVRLPDNYASLQGRSLRVMLPAIRPQLSLVNSIVELKDFRSHGQFLLSLRDPAKRAKVIERMRRFFRPKQMDRRTIRRYYKSTADGYLQAEFAILPLLADISGITTALSSLHRELTELLDRERKPQERHYSCPLDATIYEDRVDNLFVDDQWVSELTRLGVANQVRSVTYESAMFYATIRYSYSLPGLEWRNAKLKALLDSMGVNLNPGIIWNAMPWTFVIDWVANVGSFLDGFRLNNIEPRTHIQEYCSSVLIDRWIQCDLALNVGYGGMGEPVPASNIHEVAYKRTVGMADIAYWVKTSGVSTKEFSLAAALAAARR